MPVIDQRPFVLLDLDTQQDYLGPGAPLALQGVAPVRKNLAFLMQCAARTGVPVLAGCDAHRPDDPEFEAHHLPPHALAGTDGAKKVLETWVRSAPVIPRSGQRKPWPDLRGFFTGGGQVVLEKGQFDLFSNPACRELLRELNTRELLLCGAMFEHDLRATALAARILAYEVTVVEDASAFRDPAAAVAARKELLSRGVRMEPSEETLLRVTSWWVKQQRHVRETKRLYKPPPGP